LHGNHDSVERARELAGLLKGRQAHVNLIPFNEVEGLPYKRPTAQAQAGFIALLRAKGISVKVRKRKGSSIDAACGQLRRRVEAHESPRVATRGLESASPKPREAKTV
jgi:23S rRNA (adenine2503-C2)-methyltransferase